MLILIILGSKNRPVFKETIFSMKFSELTQAVDSNQIVHVDIMRNPAVLSEWVIWVRNSDGKSFLLSDELDKAIVSHDVDHLILLLRATGIKQVGINI
jgi:hypothetical protein